MTTKEALNQVLDELDERQAAEVLDFARFLRSRVKRAKPSSWPEGYFESTYGACADDPLVRGPQGEYEQRDPLDPK